MNMAMSAEASGWPYKLLNPQRHARFVLNLDNYAEIAGVPVDYIDKTMKELGCTEKEIDWVRHFPTLHQSEFKGGLMLVGTNFDPTPENRLMAMAAGFLRNFIDARVVSLDSLVRLMGNGEAFNPTVLIIPNFHRVSNTGGAGIPNWQFQQVYSLLMERFSTRRATVLHIDDEKRLVLDYGKSLSSFLYSNWSLIESL